jgi:hypothetical protein
MNLLLFNTELLEKQVDTEASANSLCLCASVTLCLEKQFAETENLALKAHTYLPVGSVSTND